MITNIHRNIMGTVSFDGKFDGMRKSQDFIVYPMRNETAVATIQSDTRIGVIDLTTGKIRLSPARKGGSFGVHLAFASAVSPLSAEELLMLKAHIFDSAHGKAGTNGVVYTDNSGAIGVFADV
jgi:hypothetical protein